MSTFLDLLFGPDADHATALVHGVLTPDEVQIGRKNGETALKAAVVARSLLIQVAQALLLVGRPRDSCIAYGACASCFIPKDESQEALCAQAMQLRPEGVMNREARKVERTIYRFWADSARNVGGAAQACLVDELGARRGVWPSVMQRPVGQFDCRLSAVPFWDASTLPCARALEQAFPAILAELQRRTKGRGDGKATFAPYKSNTLMAGAWTDLQLYANGRKDVANCRLFPRTAEVVAHQQAFNEMMCGAHFFSRLSPGTHIGAHCGPSNLRLRCHLGLSGVEGARIRVGDETRTWRVGECLVFDDSFEHEVWHEGSVDRIVLICDLWHPELSVDTDIALTMLPEELEVLHAARQGKHLVVKERLYTVGGAVKRGST